MKKRTRQETKNQVKQLFEEAEKQFPKDKEKADRLVKKARRAAMKSRMRMPGELKRRFCKNCYSFLMPGRNSRVRIRDGKIIIYCAECRNYTRLPLPKKASRGLPPKKGNFYK